MGYISMNQLKGSSISLSWLPVDVSKPFLPACTVSLEPQAQKRAFHSPPTRSSWTITWWSNRRSYFGCAVELSVAIWTVGVDCLQGIRRQLPPDVWCLRFTASSLLRPVLPSYSIRRRRVHLSSLTVRKLQSPRCHQGRRRVFHIVDLAFFSTIPFLNRTSNLWVSNRRPHAVPDVSAFQFIRK